MLLLKILRRTIEVIYTSILLFLGIVEKKKFK